MVFNPTPFSKITRGERTMAMAENLGFDQDDFANERSEDILQKVISAREYMQMDQVQKSKQSQTSPTVPIPTVSPSTGQASWTVPEIPKGDEAQYRKVGLDEYRITYRKSKGTESDETNYPPLNTFISPENLFKGNEFAMKTMPAIFEDDFGNIWAREPKQ